METKETPQLMLDLIKLLRVPSAHKDAALFVRQRVIGLGLGENCGRCGGSGHYGPISVDSGRCFNCGGAGKYMPRLSKKLYAACEEAVQAGKLDVWFGEIRAKRERNEAVANVEKQVRAMRFSLDTCEGRHWSHSLNEEQKGKYGRASRLSQLNAMLHNAEKEMEKPRGHYIALGHKRVAAAEREAHLAALEQAKSAILDSLLDYVTVFNYVKKLYAPFAADKGYGEPQDFATRQEVERMMGKPAYRTVETGNDLWNVTYWRGTTHKQTGVMKLYTLVRLETQRQIDGLIKFDPEFADMAWTFTIPIREGVYFCTEKPESLLVNVKNHPAYRDGEGRSNYALREIIVDAGAIELEVAEYLSVDPRGVYQFTDYRF